MKHLIAFTALARSGKDLSAVYASKKGYKRFAFADKVRETLYRLNPVMGMKEGKPVFLQAIVNTIGWDEAKKDPAIRQLLQRFATEVMRETVHPDVWVMGVERDIEEAEFAAKERLRVVITDLRFPNEAEWVHRHGGIVCKIVRPGIEPLRDSKGRIHKSELHIVRDEIPHDYIIHNNGTPEDLKDNVLQMIDVHGG